MYWLYAWNVSIKCPSRHRRERLNILLSEKYFGSFVGSMSITDPRDSFSSSLVRDAHARQTTAEAVQALFGNCVECFGWLPSESVPKFDRALWEMLANSSGLLGLSVPERYGGSDGNLADLAVLFHALGASGAALPLFGHVAVTAQAILAGGSEAQRGEWLPRIARGAIIASDGYCPDLSVRSGRLSGLARNVPHGRFADLLVVSNDHETWLMETADERVEIQRETAADHARPLDRVVFSDAPAAPLDDHVGAGEALHAAGYLALAAEALGGATAAADRILSLQLLKPTDPMMAAVSSARIAVLAAAEPIQPDPVRRRIALHRAKASASAAYLTLAKRLVDACSVDEPAASRHLARAQGFDRIMGPSAWHLGEIARLQAEQPCRPPLEN